MTHKINPHKVGLVLGAFLGILHALWSILVATGLAQYLINFNLRIHFINPVFTILEFNIGNAILLILITSVIGYIAGSAIAFTWNHFHKE